MLGNFFAPLAIKIGSGIILALVVALGVVMWRADAISDSREKLRNEYATEQARHAVTRQSVDTLTLEMARLVAEGELRAERLEKAMEQVAEDTAPLKADAERLERGEVDYRTVEGL